MQWKRVMKKKEKKEGKAATVNSRKNFKVGSSEQINSLSNLQSHESCPLKARGISYFFFLNSFIIVPVRNICITVVSS